MRESESYEEYAQIVVKSVYERVEKSKPIKTSCGGNSKRVGESGFEHQIDVILEGEEDLILGECKCWNKKIPTNQILTFIARVIDIKPTYSGNIHPVMFTTVGYDPGTKKLAEHFGIDLQYASDGESFSFFYKNNLVIKPKPASASSSTNCNVLKKDKDGNEIE